MLAYFKSKWITWILLFLFLSLILANLFLGAVSISFHHMMQLLFMSRAQSIQHHVLWLYHIVWWLRLPSLLAVIIVGASLGVAGAVLQGLLNNPLADPALLGVSSGAGFVVVLCFVFLGPWLWHWGALLIPLMAFVGSLSVVGLLYVISAFSPYERMASLLLAGVALNAFLGAGMMLLLSLAKTHVLRDVFFWSLGGVGGVTWPLVIAGGCCALVGFGILLPQRTKLNVWALGQLDATQSGLNVVHLRRCCILGSALVVAASVALAGPLAFIGLMVPHMVRLLVGADHRRLLPLSALLGAVLMLLAHWVCQSVLAPIVLPLGIFTALIGAPFFLALLLRVIRSC